MLMSFMIATMNKSAIGYYENCIVEVDPDGTVSWYEGEF